MALDPRDRAHLDRLDRRLDATDAKIRDTQAEIDQLTRTVRDLVERMRGDGGGRRGLADR